MSVSNLQLLVRQLRKREHREALDNLRDPNLVRQGTESETGSLRPRQNDHSGRQLDGKVVADKDDLSNIRG
jgi:hypothetical protein